MKYLSLILDPTTLLKLGETRRQGLSITQRNYARLSKSPGQVISTDLFVVCNLVCQKFGLVSGQECSV